jgi:hypothetical protein
MTVRKRARGPHDLGRLIRRVQPRHGARDERPGHDVGHERRRGGTLERPRGADQRDDGEDARIALAHHGDETTVAAIGDLSDQERQEDDRQELRQADQPEIERAAGQRVELPAHRDAQHLEAHAGQGPRGREERERRVQQERP